MIDANKASAIRLLDFRSVPMRAFHMAWLAFFCCFFGWFGIAPLMPVVRKELQLTPAQTGNIIIASVAITIVARLVFGWLCDRYGPRRAFTWLLICGSLPVMGIGLADDYTTFLLFRLAIGGIGASFVIAQFHTMVMFAPNVVGTVNAVVAGWGNLGGGVTQIAMPLLFSALLSLGAGSWWGWRLAMVVPGAALLATGCAYYFLTRDTPSGEWVAPASISGGFAEAVCDHRVWALFLLYGACFGVELTFDNIAALYFTDYFGLSFRAAGIVTGSFGLMNLFARALGGIVSDRCAGRWGVHARTILLALTIGLEGLALMVFSQMSSLGPAITAMLVASLFVKMSSGATFAVVPFVNRRALGAVAGIVSAGGNVGAVLAGMLFSIEGQAWTQALLILGAVVASCSLLAFLVRFPAPAEERLPLPARLDAVAAAGD